MYFMSYITFIINNTNIMVKYQQTRSNKTYHDFLKYFKVLQVQIIKFSTFQNIENYKFELLTLLANVFAKVFKL